MTDLDGRIGEGWDGAAPNGAHINVVVASRGSAVHAAIVGALASPRPGHLPFQVCLEVGTAVRPTTIFVNKATIAPGSEHERITWGAGQVGVAQGVLDAVAEGLVDPAAAAELTLLAAVWVDPEASDETAVKRAARGAMRNAIADAASPPGAEAVAALAARREEARAGYYRGE
jgi:5,6,7,8-tetrahydromethanopterin hydro-lyase